MDGKTFIRPLDGKDSWFVVTTLDKHKEWYGSNLTVDYPHCHFYGVYDEDNHILGFFAFAHWNNGFEVNICCVYVKEEYRQMGLFNKMIKFAIKHNTDAKIIVIGAMKDNKLANEIYSKKFLFDHYDEESNGYWYIIRDSR